MHRLVAPQLALARDAEGAIDGELLAPLVEATDADFERDRRRMDRTSALTVEALSEANGRLVQTADALRVQNRLLNAALDNMSQGLCLADAAGRMLMCNTRLTAMFGLPPPTELVNRPIAEIATLVDPFRGTPQATGSIGRYLELCAHTEHTALDLPVPGKRVVLVVHQPMGEGGYLQTFADITARHEAESRIAHLATHDVLTDLPNRRLFHERLEATLGTSAERLPCAVLCVDLDRFKAVNDTLGHPAGDQLLLQVTERLRRHVRGEDTLARLGGDEFAVLVTGMSDPRYLGAFSTRLVKHLSEPYVIGGSTIVIGATVGIAQAPRDGSDPQRLIQCADLALYCAKRDGRGQHRFFVPEMAAEARRRRALESDLRPSTQSA